MSVTFYSSTKEDTVATIVLAVAISSRVITVTTDSLASFFLFSSAFALGLTLLFAFTSYLIFRLLDNYTGNIGKGKFGYAWDHISFSLFKSKLMTYSRIFLAILVIIFPFTSNFWKKSFFLDKLWFGDGVWVLLLIFLIVSGILTIIQIFGSIKKLKIVKLVNSTEDWNPEIEIFIRENRWEEAIQILDRIKANTLSELDILMKINEKNCKKLKLFSSEDLVKFNFIFETDENWRTELMLFSLTKSFLNQSSNIIPLNNEILSKKSVLYINELIKQTKIFNSIVKKKIKSDMSPIENKNYEKALLDIFDFLEISIILSITVEQKSISEIFEGQPLFSYKPSDLSKNSYTNQIKQFIDTNEGKETKYNMIYSNNLGRSLFYYINCKTHNFELFEEVPSNLKNIERYQNKNNIDHSIGYFSFEQGQTEIKISEIVQNFPDLYKNLPIIHNSLVEIHDQILSDLIAVTNNIKDNLTNLMSTVEDLL